MHTGYARVQHTGTSETVMATHGVLADIAGGIFTGAARNRQARNQRRWARENMRHAVQWRTQDLREAGLNPILAAGMGFGGGLPSGGMSQPPDLSQLGSRAGEREIRGKDVESQTKLRGQQVKQSRQQIEFIDAQILQSRSQVGLNSAQSVKALAEARESINRRDRWSPFATGGRIADMMMGGIEGGIQKITTQQAIMEYRRTGETFLRFIKSGVPLDWAGTPGAFRNYIRRYGQSYKDSKNWGDTR